MSDEAGLLAELLQHMPADVRSRPQEERREWLRRAAAHVREQRRQQEAARAFRDAVRSDYTPLRPELFGLDAWGVVPPDDVVTLGPGVLGFPLLSPEICAALLEELAHLERWASARGLSITRPNSMNRYGLILDDVGYAGALDAMMRTIVAPLAARVHPGLGALVDHHGFLVEYAPQKDLDLDLHVDDAEVTLNVCLGETFTRGALGFSGVRCSDHVSTIAKKHEIFDVDHRPGWALLHHGRHRHFAHPLESGHRVNLILWCRAAERPALRPGEAPCPPWCGERSRV